MSETQTGSRANSGALFPERNRKSDRSPTQTGYVMVHPDLLGDIDPETGCYRIRVAAWTKQGRGGDFLSLALEKPRPAREDGAPTRTPPPPSSWGAPPARPAGPTASQRMEQVLEDEIPF